MQILFASINAFLPQIVGGVETSTLELGLALKRAGHGVHIACSLLPHGISYFRSGVLKAITGVNFPRDRYRGISIYRGYHLEANLEAIVDRVRPDALVIQGGTIDAIKLAHQCARKFSPTFFYVHDVTPIAEWAANTDPSRIRWLANSRYTAGVLMQELGGHSVVVPPYIRRQAYAAKKGAAVTMVNPRRQKGGELALDVAEICSDIPFVFVEAWNSRDPEVTALRARAASMANVSWVSATGDMRKIYRRTKLLMVPSLCRETWGRIVTEGQICGIPAIVSDVGALAETLGPGGLVMPAGSNAQTWAEAIRKLWRDTTTYESYAKSAYRFGQRPEIQEQLLASTFVDAITDGPLTAAHTRAMDCIS